MAKKRDESSAAQSGEETAEQAPDGEEEGGAQEGVALIGDPDTPYFVEAWSSYDPSLRFVAIFPVTENKGASVSNAAYYIIEPGRHSGLHSDNAEEIVFVTEGYGEVYIMGASHTLETGQFHVFPEGVPHDIYAHGGTALRLLSFFPTAEIVSTYQETMFPMGTPVLSSRREGPRMINFGPDGLPQNLPAEATPAEPAEHELTPLQRAIGMAGPVGQSSEADVSATPDSEPQDSEPQDSEPQE